MGLLRLLRSWLRPPHARRRTARWARRRFAHRRPKRKWWNAFKRLGCRKRWAIYFHGTPHVNNARSILRRGWKVGPSGGLYFAKDRATAKAYAGPNGVVLKCLVRPKSPNAATSPVVVLPPHGGFNKRRHEVRVVSVHRPNGWRVWV